MSVPNKQKLAPPTTKKQDKRNTVTKRNPLNRYQHTLVHLGQIPMMCL